jgi:hypothetical protein
VPPDSPMAGSNAIASISFLRFQAEAQRCLTTLA